MPRRPWTWQELHWRRPLDADQVVAALRLWAADQRSPRVALEVRSTNGQISYLIGTAPSALTQVLTPLRDLITPADIIKQRAAVMTARSLRASTRHRALRTEDPETVVRAVLGALTQVGPREQLVLQLLLGPRRVPLAVPTQSPSSLTATWYQVAWRGDGGPLDSEKRTALRAKVSDHGYACAIRIGVTAMTTERRRALLLNVLAAIRTSEGAGVQLTLRRESPVRIGEATKPWLWPLRLGVGELVGLTGWPLGEDDIPGQPAPHPKLLPPLTAATTGKRIVATATAPGSTANLTLDVHNATQHLWCLGPTGSGKSVLLGRLIEQDLQAGRAVVLVEPKGDLVDDVLARMPAHRRKDVVILDPNDSAPVGLNPLSSNPGRPELAADRLLAIFKQLFGRAVGPRSQDILYASLLTLARRPDASLVMLPLLLTNPGFRRSLTTSIRDPLTLEPFWATFDNWTEAERSAAVAPVMNKLRPLLRPGLRGVIGQRSPRFNLQQIFTERRVLLVPLRRGIIGPEAASLLGSMLLAELWATTQARASVPPDQRHPVMVYVDEVQDYLNLGTDLGEALAQARGYRVAFTLAHQFVDQLPREMRSAVLANARSRVSFQLPHDDAVVLAKGHPELAPIDFESLGQYEVYASLLANGQVSPYASGRTQPPSTPTVDPTGLRLLSRERYGQPLDELEAGFAALTEQTEAELGVTGRRRRTP
ncbi:MAG: type IV secretory system conjugative DNA transfer family protein [Frankiaceae bacterium]|nr:type IV secretory system conjugative DNA transfer family protein [Frankiaceae bacterium]MBV9869344.1 type IV secretory system conjugative DNA transfer family protein [Frankiaceae bacterium]